MGAFLDRLQSPPPPPPPLQPAMAPDASALVPLELPPAFVAEKQQQIVAHAVAVESASKNVGEAAKVALDKAASATDKAKAAAAKADAAVNAMRQGSTKRTRSYNPAEAVEKRPRIESA